MLPQGFEPRSPARKAGVIGRTTLRERNLLGQNVMSDGRTRIRTGVSGSEGP